MQYIRAKVGKSLMNNYSDIYYGRGVNNSLSLYSFPCISNIFMQYIRAKVGKSLMNNYIPAYIMEGGSITISRGPEVHRGRQAGRPDYRSCPHRLPVTRHETKRLGL
jgi:hypothetical protein